jgi:hypothetical protein
VDPRRLYEQLAIGRALLLQVGELTVEAQLEQEFRQERVQPLWYPTLPPRPIPLAR